MVLERLGAVEELVEALEDSDEQLQAVQQLVLVEVVLAERHTPSVLKAVAKQSNPLLNCNIHQLLSTRMHQMLASIMRSMGHIKPGDVLTEAATKFQVELPALVFWQATVILSHPLEKVLAYAVATNINEYGWHP